MPLNKDTLLESGNGWSPDDSDWSSWAPEPFSPLEEEIILSNVAERVYAETNRSHEEEASPTGEAKGEPRKAYLFAFASVAFFLAVVGLWMVSPLPWKKASKPFPELRWRGVLLQPVASQSSLSVKKRKTSRVGIVSFPLQWKAVIFSSSMLRLSFSSPRRVLWTMGEGEAEFYVKPSAKVQMVVQVASVSVEVKGTRFSVIAGPSWVRVEVKRGSVWVRRSLSKNRLVLTSRHGARIQLQPEVRVVSYRLSKNWWRQPEQRSLWLAKQNPRHLFWYASDLLQQERFPIKQRIRLVLEITDLLRQQRRYQSAQRILESIATLRAQTPEGENALFEASQMCLRRRSSLFRCKSLMEQYLQRYPKGLYRRMILLMWVRQALQQGKSCDSLRSLFLSGFENDPVIRGYCRSPKNP